MFTYLKSSEDGFRTFTLSILLVCQPLDHQSSPGLVVTLLMMHPVISCGYSKDNTANC